MSAGTASSMTDFKGLFCVKEWMLDEPVSSLANVNNKSAKPGGSLFINGKLQGRIENWDLTFGWDPASVALVLGASYVGHQDDLAVFDRALTDAEVERLCELEGGVTSLR